MGSNPQTIFGHKQAAILRALYHLSNKQRSGVLQKADLKLVRCICECALNILRGNVPLKRSHKRRLKRYACVLRRLADKNNSWKDKKRLIIQHGGFLPLLLAPILGTVLSRLIGEG